MTSETHTAMIEGKKYRVFIREDAGKVFASITSIRQNDDGSETAAALSVRQHKAKARAMSHFAPQIDAFRAKFA